MFSTMLLSSLEKVFPDRAPQQSFMRAPSIFKNETFDFQVAYYSDDHAWLWKGPVSIALESPIAESIAIYRVDLVPSEYPGPLSAKDAFLTTMPCLLPDVLQPLETLQIKILPGQWRSLWFEVNARLNCPAGHYPIHVVFKDSQGVELARESFELKVMASELPEQTLIHTEWFHTDCIANAYDTAVFSDRYWEKVKSFMACAAAHGINMILTPIFTPPLDTEVGGERLTVQLVDVIYNSGSYYFNFDKLGRWIETAQQVGIKYFEISHLFTQWGAYATPKIIATVDGEVQQLFGWDVSSKDPSYKVFLDCFLPELVGYLKGCGIDQSCYFHISDEPNLEHLESYRYARQLVDKHLRDYPIIDALSDLAFYKTGALQHPIPSNDCIHTFIDEGIKGLWTYYCCAQTHKVSNRFMAFPSFRNRILGLQLFKYDIKGFLHWGYNFYNTQFSRQAIDPYKVTDAGCAFPSGDAFLVYPGQDGPIPSLRLKVLSEAMYDLRAMQLLASHTSKQYVLDLMEAMLNEPITFSNYPQDASYLLDFRQAINDAISGIRDGS